MPVLELVLGLPLGDLEAKELSTRAPRVYEMVRGGIAGGKVLS